MNEFRLLSRLMFVLIGIAGLTACVCIGGSLRQSAFQAKSQADYKLIQDASSALLTAATNDRAILEKDRLALSVAKSDLEESRRIEAKLHDEIKAKYTEFVATISKLEDARENHARK